MPYTPRAVTPKKYSTATGRSVNCNGVTMSGNGMRASGPNGLTAAAVLGREIERSGR